METLTKPKTCKTCDHWTRHSDDKIMYPQCWEQMEMLGDCSMSDGIDDDKDWSHFFGAHGGGNYDSFACGENFGCINYKEKL